MNSENTTISVLIGLIDQHINRQLNSVLHHPRLQRLESSWRGVDQLVHCAGKDHRVKIKLLNCTLVALGKTLLQNSEFNHAPLFKHIYSTAFDQPGGEPYGLLVGDYYFSHKPTKKLTDNIGVLRALSNIASSAFVPFVSAIDPSFFGIDCFSELPTPFKLEDIKRHPDYQRWRQLTQDPDARFLGLVLPRILMRQPYNNDGVKYQRRFFTETICQHEDMLWGNACYAYACVVIRCFRQTGWFADIKGMGSDPDCGGSVALNRTYYQTDTPGTQAKFSTEYQLSDHHEKILADAGFIALRDIPAIERGIFYSCPSIQQVSKKYQREIAQVNARLSSLLHYLLCAARFAQTIKVMLRDKVGSLINAIDCQQLLTTWLSQYTTRSAGLSARAHAQYPLSAAQVEVNEIPTQPGQFNLKLYLQPHYQLDQINTQLKWVTQVNLSA